MIKDRIAILASVLFLIFGLAVIAVTKLVLGIDGDAVLISLLVLPALTYMVVSGRVKEFKAPGGLEASFYEVATAAVNPTLEKITPAPGDLQVIAKGQVSALERIRHDFNEAKPSVMTLPG